MKPLILLAQETATEATAEAAADLTRWESIKESFMSAWTWIVETAIRAVSGLNARLIIATLLAGFGLWLMLPGGKRGRKVLGAILALLGAATLISILPVIGLQFESVVFWMLAGVTVCSAAATITSRSPVYCAIWFALLLLGTGGLFMVNGAQFLGVATVAVYAGAIVVTFLFVLMLAQPEGHSFYDRISWGKMPSLIGCLAGAGLAAILVGAVAQTPLEELATATSETRSVLNEEHVANLGGRLFTTHLIAVQIAATLLMAALVGAVAMAAHGGAHKKLRAIESALATGGPPTGSIPPSGDAEGVGR